MYRGPLGFPRLTSVGPLMRKGIGFSQEIRDRDEVAKNMIEIIDENNIDRDDPSDEDLVLIAKEMANRIYPPSNNVNESKQARFKNCLANDWSSSWVDGLAESTNAVKEDDIMDKLFMQIRGCIGVTESNVADDELLIPSEYRE